MRGYLPGGERVLVRGGVTASADDKREIEILQPEVHSLAQGDPKPIRPVYRVPAIIGQRLFARMIARVLTDAADSIRGAIP
jgi:RecG-like helicase